MNEHPALSASGTDAMTKFRRFLRQASLFPEIHFEVSHSGEKRTGAGRSLYSRVRGRNKARHFGVGHSVANRTGAAGILYSRVFVAETRSTRASQALNVGYDYVAKPGQTFSDCTLSPKSSVECGVCRYPSGLRECSRVWPKRGPAVQSLDVGLF